MKAEELMIRDWVKDFYSSKGQQVARLTDNIILLKGDDITQVEAYPIPLSEEILQYNGFTNGQFYGELIIDEFQVQCDCSNLRIITKERELLNIPCQYVHELQHALRLCGIEKEIVL